MVLNPCTYCEALSQYNTISVAGHHLHSFEVLCSSAIHHLSVTFHCSLFVSICWLLYLCFTHTPQPLVCMYLIHCQHTYNYYFTYLENLLFTICGCLLFMSICQLLFLCFVDTPLPQVCLYLIHYQYTYNYYFTYLEKHRLLT